MSLLKGIGRIAKRGAGLIPGPTGTAIRAGISAGEALAGRRPSTTFPISRPRMPTSTASSFIPGGGLVPPPVYTPPPPVNGGPGMRPVGPGLDSGAVQVAGVPGAIVAGAFAAPVVARLAQAFTRFSQAIGGFLTLDAINQLFSQPFGAWPGDALGYFQSFMNKEGRSIISGGSFLPGFPMDVITDPMLDTICRAPKGYVIVEYEGQKVAMLKDVARKFGFWKPASKPPISATEYRQAKAAGRVANKVARLASTLDCKPLKVTRTCRKR